MKNYIIFITTIFLFYGVFNNAFSQPVEPSVILRVKDNVASPTGAEYYFDVTIPVALKKAVYDEMKKCPSDPTTCLNIGGLFSKTDILLSSETSFSGYPSYKLVVSKDCSDDTTRNKFCIYLPPSITNPVQKFADKNYQMVLMNYLDDSDTLVYKIIKADKFETKITPKLVNCERNLNQIGLAVSKITAKRNTEIKDWLQTKFKPQNVLIQTERINPPDDDLNELRVVNYTITGNNQVIICIETDKHLPIGEFDAKLIYRNGNAPPELFSDIVFTEIKSLNDGSSPDANPTNAEKQKVGARELKNNLDIQVALTSAHENVKENNLTVRKRITRGVFDIRLVPFRKIYPARTGESWDKEIVPFFIDAKVATGKIEDSTLALNRVNFGTSFIFTHIPKDPNTSLVSSNFYQFRLSGINSSDRDFKQVEAKFNLEFRPFFNAINKPIKDKERGDTSVLAERPRTFPGTWGFEFYPVAGFELGGAYRRHRPAAAIKSAPAVFRGFAGFETIISPTQYFSLTLKEMFYVRSKWESKDDRYRNYYEGKLEYFFGKSSPIPMSLFVSYERGSQPPFTDEQVNTVKIGYRLQANWFQFPR